eukprot:2730459-Rhodomonas_salina.1
MERLPDLVHVLCWDATPCLVTCPPLLVSASPVRVQGCLRHVRYYPRLHASYAISGTILGYAVLRFLRDFQYHPRPCCYVPPSKERYYPRLCCYVLPLAQRCYAQGAGHRLLYVGCYAQGHRLLCVGCYAQGHRLLCVGCSRTGQRLLCVGCYAQGHRLLCVGCSRTGHRLLCVGCSRTGH